MRRLLVALVLLLAACGDGEPPEIAGDDPPVRPTYEVAPTSVDLGPGSVMGVHPSEPLAYVAVAVAPTGGCEGGEQTELAAKPIAGGEGIDAGDGLGSGRLVPGGPDGRVLVVDQCEGFLSSLVSAVPQDDGTLTDPEELDVDGLAPWTIRWSGHSLLGVGRDELLAPIGAVRVVPGGATEVLDEDPAIIAVDELHTGELVTATPSQVRLGGEAPVDLAVTSIATSPDREQVAVFGEGGVTVLRPGEAPRHVADHAASAGSWAPDGDAIAYLRLVDDATVEAWVVPLDGSDPFRVDEAGFAEPRFSADGEWLVYDRPVDSGEGFEEPRATARRVRS